MMPQHSQVKDEKHPLDVTQAWFQRAQQMSTSHRRWIGHGTPLTDSKLYLPLRGGGRCSAVAHSPNLSSHKDPAPNRSRRKDAGNVRHGRRRRGEEGGAW